MDPSDQCLSCSEFSSRMHIDNQIADKELFGARKWARQPVGRFDQDGTQNNPFSEFCKAFIPNLMSSRRQDQEQS